jgi:hypothetical protein
MTLQTADFNADGWNDLLTVTYEEMTSPQYYVAYLDLSGPFGGRQTFDAGTGPYQIATGDFALFGLPPDGRPDFAIYKFYWENDFSYWWTVEVYRNLGPVTFSEAMVTEGNSGTVEAVFGVSLEYPDTTDVTVHYRTDDGFDATATAGSDYVPTSGSVTIPAGQMGATFTVPVVGDRLPEPTERLKVWASYSSYMSLVYGVILDDDNAPEISVGDATVTEGNNGAVSAAFTVTLSQAGSEPITVDYATADDAATSGDYQTAAGTLTFAPGEMSKTTTVLVNGDSKREANEEFYLDLSGLSGNALFAKNRGIGTILNDD